MSRGRPLACLVLVSSLKLRKERRSKTTGGWWARTTPEDHTCVTHSNPSDTRTQTGDFMMDAMLAEGVGSGDDEEGVGLASGGHPPRVHVQRPAPVAGPTNRRLF